MFTLGSYDAESRALQKIYWTFFSVRYIFQVILKKVQIWRSRMFIEAYNIKTIRAIRMTIAWKVEQISLDLPQKVLFAQRQ